VAIKNVIAKGIGFGPGSSSYIVTHGFSSGVAPAPGFVYTYTDYIARSYETLADIEQFIEDYADVTIVNQGDLTAAELIELDDDGDGTLTLHDRDWLLDFILKDRFRHEDRLPWSQDDSDPLDLIDGRSNVIIIDQLHEDAVVIRPGAAGFNDCETQAGAFISNLFSGHNYLQTLWHTFTCLDEFGSIDTRRFPKNGGVVTIYVRGGDHTVDDEIVLTKNDGAATVQSRIRIRNYPGEYPTLYCGNKAVLGVYPLTTVLGFSRINTTIDGFEIIGYRESAGVKIFGPNTISLTDNYRFVRNNVHNCRGIAPNHARADALPHLVDSQFNNRSPAITSGTSLNCVTSSCDVGVAEDNFFMPAPPDWPYENGTANGEGFDIIGATDIIVRRNCFDGISPHAMIRLYQSTGITLEENCVSNAGHTCILVYGDTTVPATDITIQFNRVHGYCLVDASSANGIQTAGMQDSLIKGNVIYNAGLEEPGWGITIEMNPISSAPTDADAQNNIVEENILYGTAFFLGYAAGQNTGFPDGLPLPLRTVADNTIRNNIFINLPAYNASTAVSSSYNGLIRINLNDATSVLNDFYGNAFTGNILIRDDGGTLMAEQYSGSTSRNWNLAQINTLPNCSGNISTDPMFRNPLGGDFTLDPASVVTWLDAETPLEAECLCDDEEFNVPSPSNVLTFADLIDHLTAWSRGGALEAEHRDIRMAAYQAYQSVCLDSDFPYLLKHHRLRLQAPYDTGTVSNTTGTITGASNATPIVITSATHGLVTGDTVDITGVLGNTAANDVFTIKRIDANSFSLDESSGNAAWTSGGTWANLRSLTFTGSLLPPWTKYGRIVIDDVVYTIESRTSGTVCILDENIKPVSRISSEEFTLFRSQYELPEDYKAGYAMYEQDRRWASAWMHPDEWLASERNWLQSARPFCWTILPDPDRYGCFIVALHGYPDATETMDFMYYGQGRAIRLCGYEARCQTGTASASINGITVTGLGTSWSADMKGAMLRMSLDSTNWPTGNGDLYPYAEQQKISAVNSTTSITIDGAWSQAFSGVKFRISDPLDIDASIVEALKRRAEHEISIYRGQRIVETKGLYNDALVRCLERNSRSRVPYLKGDIKAGPWVQWWNRGTITSP
jgi:hypothetical protein